MSKLKELEKRLRDEPDNLGLRVMVAGALREAGKLNEAVEHYRTVAIAYRDQGRAQQAIAVCRSILEIAPNDPRCHALLGELVASHKARTTAPSPAFGSAAVREIGTPPPPPPPRARPLGEEAIVEPTPPPAPARRSSLDVTPLPVPLPYHVADPTTRSLKRLSDVDLPSDGEPTRPGGEPVEQQSGLASAARTISKTLIAAGSRDDEDLAAELDTRQRRKIASTELDKISRPPPTVPVERIALDDDAPTPVPARDTPVRDTPSSRDTPVRKRPSEDEDTRPRELMSDVPTRSKRGTPGPLALPFFAPLPAERRAAVLSRFTRRTVAAGSTVIRQGEMGHPLVLVVRGKLALRVQRPNGALVELAPIADGEHVGEMSLLARTPCPTSVVASTATELLQLASQDFYEIAGAFPALWAALKEVAERRTRELQAKLR